LNFRDNLNSKEKVWSYIIIILAILFLLPLSIPKIICNDELISRFWSLNGVDIFYNYFLNDHIQKGRALSTYFVTTTMYSGFLGAKYGLFRIIPMLTILLTSVLFSFFIFKLLRNKVISILLGISILAFLPTTFEATSPNSFTALYNIPFAVLICSFVFFIDYLENQNKNYLITSMFLFFLTLLTYEVFVTYTPMFVFIIVYKNGFSKDKIKNLIKTSTYPVCVAIIFLILYFWFSKKFPSNYPGNQIGGFTLSSSFTIIKQLILSSFPGYFIFNDKYFYLVKLFSKNQPLWNIISLRSIITSILTTYIFWVGIFKFKIKKNIGIRKNLLFLIGMFFFMVIPNLPWAVSKMYQGIVNNKDFIALPVTYFNYFFTSLFILYTFYTIINFFKIHTTVVKFLIVLTGVFVFVIQIMNDIILKRQLSDYNRIITIEKMLETDFIKRMNHHSIFSKSLYETRLSLAIHKGYWSQYTKLLGLDINISEEKLDQELFIEFLNDEYFIINYKDDHIVILSPEKKIGQEILVKSSSSNLYQKVLVSNGIKDKGMYLYEFNFNEKQIENIPYTPENFYDELYSVGNNLSTCSKVSGFWVDHWVTNESIFKIRSGEKGLIKIKGYYSEAISEKEIDGSQKVNCFIEDALIKEFVMDKDHFEIEIPCKKNSIVELKIS